MNGTCISKRFGFIVLTVTWLAAAVLPAVGAVKDWSSPVRSEWISQTLDVPYAEEGKYDKPALRVFRQDYEKLHRNEAVIGGTLQLGERKFERGLGTHSISEIRVYSPEPITGFTAWVGVDNNASTGGQKGSAIFFVEVDGQQLYSSPVLRSSDPGKKVDVKVDGGHVLDLKVSDGGDGPAWDHADWAMAKITLADGKQMYLDEIEAGPVPSFAIAPKYPFSFTYDGKNSNELLPDFEKVQKTIDGDQPGRLPGHVPDKQVTTWTCPKTGLKVHWEVVAFDDFPAVEWLLRFENTGDKDTPIIENIQALDLTFQSPVTAQGQYRLVHTNGAPANPTDFEVNELMVDQHHRQQFSGFRGRSSFEDFPFFKLETRKGTYIIAIGWSGQWHADFHCPQRGMLRISSGLEKTHFRLHPGEKVRMPRILVLHHPTSSLEANAVFRRLIYKHYTATRSGKKILPVPYCNTCFTRGGGWLNECNAENQISLIRAYAPLGLEALLTDAGWFEGGWPNGAGNWTPRKDAYPEGMGPVAKAAKEEGMIYGLWFEPERVMTGTDVHRNHPEWCLSSRDGGESTYLLNFGKEEVRDYFFNIVKGFMELPGFAVYRQDCNIGPLAYWRYNDAPDRQGITEIRYITGLYEYWGRIAENYPDSLRIECASGGRRIDLETVMRMHVHQKTDYWFRNVVDQASIWGLSQYLPNNVFMAPVNRLDDYSFNSAMHTSLCLGWIADAENFDTKRAKELLDRYRKVRHLMIGSWYPLFDYSRDLNEWIGSQFHRPELDEGMLLMFRRKQSPYPKAELKLHGLQEDAQYKLTSLLNGKVEQVSGAELMDNWTVTLPSREATDLIVYEKLGS